MVDYELHSLYWPNASREVIELHRRVFHHLGLVINYTEEAVPHGEWMDRILKDRFTHVDTIGFLDIDCFAYSREAIDAAYGYVRRTGSFIGLAQSSNHLPTAMHIYAAPSFLMISRRAFEALKRPSLVETSEGDVAQHLSRVADSAAFGYRVLFPFAYHAIPQAGPWRLGNYGYYGLGTEYSGGFFHNFNSRLVGGIDVLSEKAESILANRPQPTTGSYSCTDLSFDLTPASEPLPRTLRYRLLRARQRAVMSLPKSVRRWKRAASGQPN